MILLSRMKSRRVFSDGSYNLYGRSMNGSNDVKIALDASRVKALEDIVRDKIPNNENKNQEWSKCTDAIHIVKNK